MTHSTALRLRAISVVALFVGFYVLALGIVAGLLGLLWAMVVVTHHIYIKAAVLIVGICVVILYSIFPRIDRFAAPGPRLRESQQPRLFERLRAIARATGQKLPREVYLLADVNAFVTNRGGIMGIGSRRVMGIGLPLMHVLSQAQFSAVIAHEFGHYVGGDTRLGPWIYKTRLAMARTVENLSERHAAVSSVFLAYGRMFMRHTQLISRAQEFAADALAARVAGAEALVQALKTIEGVSRLYSGYWGDYVLGPAILGMRPRILEGLSRFLGNDEATGLMNRVVSEALEHGEGGEYDSHPPLAERVRAVEALPVEGVGLEGGADARAVDLLDTVENLEIQLLVFLGVANAGEMEVMNWGAYRNEILERRFKPWQATNRHLLEGVTPVSIHEHLRDGERARHVRFPDGGRVDGDEVWRAWRMVLTAGFSLALRRAGWDLNTDPGRGSVFFHKGKDRLDPEQLVAEAAASEFPVGEWRELTEEAGIAHLNFGDVAATEDGTVA